MSKQNKPEASEDAAVATAVPAQEFKTAQEPKSAPAKSIYTVDELAEAAASFGRNVMPECVVAALREAGKTEATREEAQQLVTAFMRKEVK